VEERRFGTKYTVLDDLRGQIKDEYLERPSDEQVY
jgi:hypothetical protein